MLLEQKGIKYQGKVVFEKITISADFRRIPKMFSEDEACFLFLTKGAFHFRTPTSILTFKEGDAMLAKCGNYLIEQAGVYKNLTGPVISATGAFFYPAMVKAFFETDLSLENFRKFDASKIRVQPLLRSFVESIDYLLDNPSLADENLIATKLKELLLLLSKSEQANSINEFVASLFAPNEYSFKEIIKQNQYSNLSLAEMAYLCNMSVATFKRKFTRMYNESPAKYFLIQKLERSAKLLQINSKTVSDIAYECGFDTVSNFDRSFKKHFNVSPSQYRLSQIDK